MNVLIVEDDREIRETLAEVLRGEGYAVEAAANGKEALERLRADSGTGLVLLDLMMPVMSGWEMGRAMRSDPKLQDIPVVVMSAAGQVRERARQIGAVDAFEKPLDLERLLSSIERYCKAG
jgi:CheY-like chemotaxis protein